MSTEVDDRLFHGHVTNVARETHGDELAGAALAGATVLTVLDTADYDEDGGTVRIDDGTNDGAGAIHDYVSVTDDPPTLKLATPLAAGHAVGTRVDVWDTDAAAPVSEWVADVVDDANGDVIQATVEHALVGLLASSVRAGGTESVVCVLDDDDLWSVTRILGRSPEIDGDFVMVPGPDGPRPLPPTLQDIYDQADEIAQAAQDAADTGTAAQTTANGKNTVTYSANPPGATPNKAGDIWWQRKTTPESPIVPVVVAQYEGQGDTAWVEVKLSSLAIAYIDAAVLTAGSAFVNGLRVLTNFTLGGPDANNNIVDGVIQTYDFANQPIGVLISKNLGVVAKGATIAGSTIIGSTVSGGTLSVGTPGATEIYLSTATDPLGVSGAWAIQDFRIAQGWNAGRLWATYNPSDPYIGTSAGILKLSSPYVGGSIGNAAVMQLMAGGNASSYATFDAGTVALRSNRMRFESRNSSAFDVEVVNTGLLQFKHSGGDRLGVNLIATGSGFGAVNLQARYNSGGLKQMMLSGAGILLNSGDTARDITIGSNFSFPTSPFIVDAGADVGISFRNITVSGTNYPNGIAGVLDVVGALGNNFKVIRAYDFAYMSDVSLKDVIEDAPAGMLDQVEALRPVEYGIAGFDPETRRTRGLISQEVEAAIPGATVGEDGERAINSYVLITTLIGAVQELSAKVAQLEAAA